MSQDKAIVNDFCSRVESYIDSKIEAQSKSKVKDNTPRIYVACLAAYNNGKLHGAWIDADQAIDDIRLDIDRMLLESPEKDAEEWAIHDTENFGGIVSEYEDLETVAELGRAIAEHGDPFLAYAKHHYAPTVENFEDEYEGEYEDEEDFAYHIGETCWDMDSTHQAWDYIDWEKYGRDLFMGDYYSIDSDTGIYVFRNC